MSTGTVPVKSPNLPPQLMQAVSLYRALCADYATITDPTVKAAYLTVLNSKYSALTSNINEYTTSIQSYISSIQVTS